MKATISAFRPRQGPPAGTVSAHAVFRGTGRAVVCLTEIGYTSYVSETLTRIPGQGKSSCKAGPSRKQGEER